MPTLANHEPLLFLQKQALDVSSPRSPLSARYLKSCVPEGKENEILEVQTCEEEDEEEAAFRAEALAFARKCNVHEIAVTRLVQDLVEDDNTTVLTEVVSSPTQINGSDKSATDVLLEQDDNKRHRERKMSNKTEVHPGREGIQDKVLRNGLSKTHDSAPAKEGLKQQSKVRGFFKIRKSSIGYGNRRVGNTESVLLNEHNSLLNNCDNPDLGPFLLKLAKQAIASGDRPKKALDFAIRAAKSYEIAADGKPSLDLVMSLHVLAAVHCSIGQYDEAVTVLKRSIDIRNIESGGQEHALAAFAGYMQLGDTLALLGRGEEALSAYHSGLEIQVATLGNKDPLVGETCQYLAEAHAQALQFDKAAELCQRALDIVKEANRPASMEEATDRRLMGLIYNGKGQPEAALEHLVLASMILIANSKDLEVAAVDASIGDTYVSLGRIDEAIFSYQKALTVFKASKGENHITVASVYVSLAGVYLKSGKHREARTYCDSALRIYNRLGGRQHLEEVATGLTDIAIIYEALGEHDRAISFLQKALAILEAAPGQQSAVAGVEAQIGVLHYIHGNYIDSRIFFGKAVSKLRGSAEKDSSLFGIVLNQMGLACVQLADVQAAVEAFEESKNILEAKCGLYHPDTLSVYSNLSGAYDALGRLDDAIAVLEYTLEAREEMSKVLNVELEDEKTRLSELLREARCLRTKGYTT